MSMNSKKFLILENVRKFLSIHGFENVYDFKYVHEFKKMFIISKVVYDFTKLRVIVYLADATKCDHGN